MATVSVWDGQTWAEANNAAELERKTINLRLQPPSCLQSWSIQPISFQLCLKITYSATITEANKAQASEVLISKKENILHSEEAKNDPQLFLVIRNAGTLLFKNRTCSHDALGFYFWAAHEPKVGYGLETHCFFFLYDQAQSATRALWNSLQPFEATSLCPTAATARSLLPVWWETLSSSSSAQANGWTDRMPHISLRPSVLLSSYRAFGRWRISIRNNIAAQKLLCHKKADDWRTAAMTQNIGTQRSVRLSGCHGQRVCQRKAN